MLEGMSMTPVQSMSKKMSVMHHAGHPGGGVPQPSGIMTMKSSSQDLPPEVLAAISGIGNSRRNIKIRSVTNQNHDHLQ